MNIKVLKLSVEQGLQIGDFCDVTCRCDIVVLAFCTLIFVQHIIQILAPNSKTNLVGGIRKMDF